MAISKFLRSLRFTRQREFEPDPELDDLIRDVLREDAHVPLPVGSWDRLRKSITDRKPIKSYGMWILDEPLRDPPKSPPGTLNERELALAMRLYTDRRHLHTLKIKESLWSNWAPSFAILFNW